MLECLKCRSARVVQGKIVPSDGGTGAVFQPHGIRFLAMTLTYGTALSDESFGCLDCGLVWSSAPPEKLAAFIRKHCEKT